MRKKLNSRISLIACFVFLVFLSFSWLGQWLDYRGLAQEAQDDLALLGEVRKSLDTSLEQDQEFPSIIESADGTYEIEYTYDQELMDYIKRQLRYYHSDYSAVTVIDNNTGEVLAAIGYDRQHERFNHQLAFSSTHPSASLIKIVTSAGLIEKADLNPNTVFNFRGRSTTLYRHQLDSKNDRWTRRMNFATAFAQSNNVIFAKAAISNLNFSELFQTATSFGFNRQLFKEISMSKSFFPLPQDRFNMAELASGFNTEAVISPVHAALMASVIANDGIMRYPRVVDRIKDANDQKVLLEYQGEEERVLEKSSIRAMKSMMEMTIDRGTARTSFRKMNRKVRDQLLIGGKTGSITGGIPFGKRDWFAAYASPKADRNDKGISISVMNVNVKKWYVKSSFLAKEIIEYYYKNKIKIKSNSSKLARR